MVDAGAASVPTCCTHQRRDSGSSWKPFYASAASALLVSTSVAVGLVAAVLPYLPVTAAMGFLPLPLPLVLSLMGIVIAYRLSSELLKSRIGAFQSRWSPRRRGRI